MSEPLPYDVICAGYACYDLNFLIGDFLKEDTKVRANHLIKEGGGPAANAAVTVSRLGGRSVFLGYRGNDNEGSFIEHALHKEGVETWFGTGTTSTPIASILVTPEGQRSVVSYPSYLPQIKCPPLDIFYSAKCFLFDAHQHEIAEELIDIAQETKTPTILDAGSVHPGTQKLWQAVTYPIASAPFVCEMTGKENPEEAFHELSKNTPTLVVTSGANGVYWKYQGEWGHMPAIDIEPIDTTGAGDIFHGTFALAISRGFPFIVALGKANEIAGKSCQYPGVRSSIPNHLQEQFINPPYSHV